MFRFVGWALAMLLVFSIGASSESLRHKTLEERSKLLSGIMLTACVAAWMLAALARGVR